MLDNAVSVGFSAIRQIMSMFASPPMIYFVAVALVGATAGVALKFVPMRRR